MRKRTCCWCWAAQRGWVSSCCSDSRGRILKSDDRSPVWAWLMVAAGALSVVLCVTFIGLSSARVFASWVATGTVEPVLVLLSLAWFVAIAAIITVLVSVKRACRHLVECYHADDTPFVVRWLRRWVER